MYTIHASISEFGENNIKTSEEKIVNPSTNRA